MTFGPAVGNVGMYVAREMLAAVPEEQQDAYIRMVEEISDLKYQLGVEVARQLPRLLAEHDSDVVDRYLTHVRRVARIQGGWKSGVEVAKHLPDLFEAPDERLAPSYVEIVSDATKPPPEGADAREMLTELERLEAEIRDMEPKVKRAQELRAALSANERRDEKRRKHAVELAAALPPILARLRPRYRPAYLEQVHLVAAADPEASLEAADTLLDLLNSERLSPVGTAEWVNVGLIELEKNREVGRGYFRLGSKRALQVLDELKEGLSLKEVARVLKLFATALSGSDVTIRAANEMQAVDATVAEHIILPPDMRYFEEDEDNFRAYKIATAQGAGRIEFGTYELRLDDIPETVERLSARYGEAR